MLTKIEWQVTVASDEEKIVVEIKCRVNDTPANGNALAELLQPNTLTDAMKKAIEARLAELEKAAMQRRGALI